MLVREVKVEGVLAGHTAVTNRDQVQSWWGLWREVDVVFGSLSASAGHSHHQSLHPIAPISQHHHGEVRVPREGRWVLDLHGTSTHRQLHCRGTRLCHRTHYPKHGRVLSSPAVLQGAQFYNSGCEATCLTLATLKVLHFLFFFLEGYCTLCYVSWSWQLLDFTSCIGLEISIAAEEEWEIGLMYLFGQSWNIKFFCIWKFEWD